MQLSHLDRQFNQGVILLLGLIGPKTESECDFSRGAPPLNNENTAMIR